VTKLPTEPAYSRCSRRCLQPLGLFRELKPVTRDELERLFRTRNGCLGGALLRLDSEATVVLNPLLWFATHEDRRPNVLCGAMVAKAALGSAAVDSGPGSKSNCLTATASALSRSGASTDPRYSPLLRIGRTTSLVMRFPFCRALNIAPQTRTGPAMSDLARTQRRARTLSCPRCETTMEAIVTVEPTLGDPGLIGYECPKCVYVTSELVQPSGGGKPVR
jgi:hypothetical protein